MRFTIDYKQVDGGEDTQEENPNLDESIGDAEEDETEEDYSFTEASIQFNYNNDVIRFSISNLFYMYKNIL